MGVVPEPVVSPKFLSVVIAGLAVLSVVGFGLMAAWAIRDVWMAETMPMPDEAFTFVETGLAGLVGGIVAAAFGVSRPNEKISGLSNLSTAGASERQWVGALYVSVYVVVGIATVFTWLFKAEVASTVVKNLGSTFIGMLIPVVAGYFAR